MVKGFWNLGDAVEMIVFETQFKKGKSKLVKKNKAKMLVNSKHFIKTFCFYTKSIIS